MAWLPDQHGNFHKPGELFVPTAENRRLLGDSVAYLHPDFDLTDKKENEAARWLAQKLGIHLTANTESVLNYLRSLSGTDVDIKAVEPLYRFLDQQGERRQKEFQEEKLIFTPAPISRWWQAHEVFWEDENAVFGDHRGYLKAYDPEILKAFFVGVGVAERAAPLDYVRAIREVAENNDANDEAIHKRLLKLYRHVLQELQDGGEWQNEEEWEEVLNGKCWLGRKGNRWGFFSRTELVQNDHSYYAECFKDRIPFWAFDELTDLAEHLEVKRVSQAEVTFKPIGEQEALDEETRKLRALANDIQCFLESPQWSRLRSTKASPSILSSLRVCLVKDKYVAYSLNGVFVEDHQPRPSHLDVETETIYLALDADKQDYPDLIGDALQDYFGVPELREFVKDLMRGQKEKVLERWRRRGLEVKQVEEAEPAEQEKGEGKKPEPTPPTTLVSQRVSGNGGSWGGKGGYGGGGGGGETVKHLELKERLAENPSLLGEGLTLVRTEYEFPSGDRVDVLLVDSVGRPVTVEVEPGIPPRNYVGVWQAVKYKHLAAVERGLPCEEVRSILVAPSIPDDVKEQCEKLGVEHREVKFS